jgi:hypothetical protein
MKSPIGTVTQRQRATRHGEPHKMRKRSVKDINGKATVVFEWVPVPAEGYERKGVALRPTTARGQQNKPENMAPKGKAGQKK